MMDRNQWVVATIEATRGYLCHQARRFNADADDLIQDVSVLLIQFLDTHRLPAEMLADPARARAYLFGCVRTMALRILCHKRTSIITCLSLDIPVSSNSGSTLGDLLADPRLEETDPDLEMKEQAVHVALRRLPLDAQYLLLRRFGINSYNPVPRHGRIDRQRKNPSNILKTAYAALCRDELIIGEVRR